MIETQAIGISCTRLVMTTGLTIRQIVDQVDERPAAFELRGEVRINGERLRRWIDVDGRSIDAWTLVRPRTSCQVTLHMPPQGGKLLGSIGTIFATIALLAVTSFISAGGLPLLFGAGAFGGLFTAGSLSATLLAAGVGILGRMAILAFSPPPARNRDQGSAPLGNAAADGNLLQPGAPIPRVAGAGIKVYPPLAAVPLIEIAGDDEIVEAAYVLAGPHRIEHIKIEDIAADQIDDLTYFAQEGTSTTAVSLLGRRGVQRNVQFQMQGYKRDSSNPSHLYHQSNPDLDLPNWHSEVSRQDPDEIWLHLVWPSGMGRQDGATQAVMPVRMRMRVAGTTAWKNLPEMHFSNIRSGTLRKFIKLIWGDAPAPVADQQYSDGAYESWFYAPPQLVAPVSPGFYAWASDLSFWGGTINGSPRVVRNKEGFAVYLDPTKFPRGQRWEVSLMIGSQYDPSLMGVDGTGYYQYNAVKIDLFSYRTDTGSKTVPTLGWYTAATLDSCMLLRFASVRNSPPLPTAGNASIEVRGRNLNLTRVSCEASGLVPAWTGTEWSSLTVSDNPADHFHDVLGGALTDDPVESDIIDESGILAWRDNCTAKGYKIGAVFDGRQWEETLGIIAGTGLAKLKAGSTWGVAWDFDTSAAAWKQLFTPRNSNNLQFSKSFDKIPDAFRVTYRDRALDFDQTERLVIRRGLALEEVRDILPVDAAGIVNADLIDTRFSYDLASLDARDYILSFDASVDSLVSEMGDLIGVSHVMLQRQQAAARIKSIETDPGSGLAVAMVLDNFKTYADPRGIEAVPEISAIGDMDGQGVALAVAISTGLGTTLTAPISTVEGVSNRIVFTTPFDASTARAGDQLAIGPAAKVAGRYKIINIEGTKRFNARVSCLPEAPEIWA